MVIGILTVLARDAIDNLDSPVIDGFHQDTDLGRWPVVTLFPHVTALHNALRSPIL